MPVERVHHVAFAVEDLDKGIETYERLYGARVEFRGRLESQGVEASVRQSRLRSNRADGPNG